MEGRKNRSWSEHLRDGITEPLLGRSSNLKRSARSLWSMTSSTEPLVTHPNGCFVQGVQHDHGSQLPSVVIHRWPSFSRFGSSKLPSFHRCLAPAHTCAHPTNVYVSVHPHFAGNVHASVRASGIEKERSCRTACATSPMLVGRDRSFRNWSAYQDRNQRWVSLHESALASMGQQALARTQGRKNLECRLPCSNKHVQDCNRHFGTQRHDHVPDASQWSQHRSGARFQNSARSEVSGERSAVSQDTILCKIITVLTRYRPIVLELI